MSSSYPYVLSIIIPVYGVEDYIEACITSLLPQLSSEVECIIVDDGCKDRSIEILEAYLATHSSQANIRIIHQENQGLSMARNNGYAVAKGQYIAYLDSDDYVEPHFLARILEVIRQAPEVELIHFNALMENKQYGTKLLVLAEQTGLVYADTDYLKRVFLKNYWYTWLRVYNRKLLKDFQFPPNHFYEDMLSIPFLYRKGLIIYEIAEPLFRYRYRADSITNGEIKPEHIKSLEYGLSLYRDKLENPYFQILYEHLILALFERNLKLGFAIYSKFLYRIHHDLDYLQDKLQHLNREKRLMLQYPKLFYWYKNWLSSRRSIF